jgi:hypothetical protein
MSEYDTFLAEICRLLDAHDPLPATWLHAETLAAEFDVDIEEAQRFLDTHSESIANSMLEAGWQAVHDIWPSR